MTKLKFNDMSSDEIDQFIKRVEEVIDYGLSLEKKNLVLLLEAFKACLFLQEKLINNDLTILKLKKLLGMVQSSERISGLLDQNDEDKQEEDKRKKKTEKRPLIPKSFLNKLPRLNFINILVLKRASPAQTA